MSSAEKPQISLEVPRNALTRETSSCSLESGPTLASPSAQPSATSSFELSARDASPLSPFYSHPQTRYSLEALKSDIKGAHVVEVDLEAGDGSVITVTPQKSRQPCQVWPGRHELKEQHRRKKVQMGCGGRVGRSWRGLSSTTRVFIKVLIALCIVGVGVGIGLGISKKVGGGVWGQS